MRGQRAYAPCCEQNPRNCPSKLPGAMNLSRFVTFRNFTIAVGLCLTASASLALTPLINPQVPLYPFIVSNWVLMIVVVGVFRRSRAEWVTRSESIWWDRLTSLVIVSFTIAGFFAVHNGETLIRAGDIALAN